MCIRDRSYTDFNIEVDDVEANEDKVTVEATVTNVGDTYSGKEDVYKRQLMKKEKMKKKKLMIY